MLILSSLFYTAFAVLAMTVPTASRALTGRRIVHQQQAAQAVGIHIRTVRNWITQGLVTGYRLPGERSVWVDLDEIEAHVKAKPQPFGPRARIVQLVDEYRPDQGVNRSSPAQDADQGQAEVLEEVAR